MPFKKGVSANPKGRPPGIKDKRSVFRELVENRKEELMNKALDLALSGNEKMLSLLLDRLLPPKVREEPLHIDTLEGPLTVQGKKILSLMTEGKITLSECTALLHALTTQIKLIETDELINRIQKLEDITNANKQ